MAFGEAVGIKALRGVGENCKGGRPTGGKLVRIYQTVDPGPRCLPFFGGRIDDYVYIMFMFYCFVKFRSICGANKIRSRLTNCRFDQNLKFVINVPETHRPSNVQWQKRSVFGDPIFCGRPIGNRRLPPKTRKSHFRRDNGNEKLRDTKNEVDLWWAVFF